MTKENRISDGDDQVFELRAALILPVDTSWAQGEYNGHVCS